MNPKKTLFLAVLLAIVVVFITRFQLPKEEITAKKGLIFKEVPAARIESIGIKTSADAFSLRNREPKSDAAAEAVPLQLGADELSKWEISSVPGSRIDPGVMNSLLTALAEFKLDDPIPAKDVDSDLGVYGLKDPALTLSVQYMGGMQVVQVGKNNDYVGKRYAKLSDSSEIFMTAPTLFVAADKKSSDFRDHLPITFVDNDLKSIELRSKDSTTRLEVDSARKWNLKKPFEASASASAVAMLARDIRSVRAKDFIDDADAKLAEYKLDKPDASVFIEFSSDSKRTPLEIRFSTIKKDKSETNYAYVKGGPSIYTLNVDPLPTVMKPAEALREKQLFSYASDLVEKVIYEFGGSKLQIEKKGDDWTVNGKTGDRVFVVQLIMDLSRMEATAFPKDTKNLGFDKPRAKITVSTKDETGVAKDRVLIVGGETKIDKDKKGYYAGVDDLREPFIISEEVFKKLQPHEEALIQMPTPVPTSHGAPDAAPQPQDAAPATAQ